MSFYQAIDNAVSGASLSRFWLDAISDNVANVNTIRPADEEPFRARIVVAEAARDASGARAGVRVREVLVDGSDPAQVWSPGHELADENGMITRPVVDLSVEMSNMIIASRSYQANLSVIDRVRDSYMAALRIGQR
jgi:flagellar basal-body rod protein FlgC